MRVFVSFILIFSLSGLSRNGSKSRFINWGSRSKISK